MEWTKTAENVYPNIILSDCIVNSIQSANGHVIFHFIESGIIVKSDMDCGYYRTKAAQIQLEACNIDDITIKYVHKRKWKDDLETAIVKEIRWEEFSKKICNKKWQFEIVEEFYSATGGVFVGQVRKPTKKCWCMLKIYFHNIKYFWNEIDYSSRVD